jgi:hypothetical protein
MLNFNLDFKGNWRTLESIDLVYTLADLQSDEEAESIVLCLCLDIDMTGKSEFCVILDGMNLSFFWSPTLADFLIDLPSFINRVECGIFKNYRILLNYEVNDWEIVFMPFSQNQIVVEFDDKEGNIIKTDTSVKQLKKEFNLLLNSYINILENIFPNVLKIPVFKQWLISSFYENI